MSTEIDQRVVEMKFDNKNFEKNISTSMDSLEKFKASLKFSGATKGMEEIESKASKFNMSKMEQAVDKVEAKFSTLSIVAVDAILRITRKAEDAAVKLVKSLSTDNIAAGWAKLADKTESVQTILNATGKSIDEVNGYLDKLMWFSDETSYGFNDMTKAIAQMTSSGGDISKLIPMVEGVANATAFAGKSADVFSRVMYNLNQSYATGALKYIDWKSLEMAGVASKQLKEELIAAGVALGTINEGEITLSNFNETLKNDWATTAVMEKAFGRFAERTEEAYKMVQSGEVETATEAYEILAEKYDDITIVAAKAAQEAMTFKQAIEATQDAVSSKWMKTFELIFGNYKQAKKLWSDLAEELYTVFAEGGDERNNILAAGLQHRELAFQELAKRGLPSIADLKTYLAEAAQASDDLDDSMKSLIKNNFEESLQEGWVNAEILSKALAKSAYEAVNLSDAELQVKGYTDEQIEKMRQFADDLYAGKINLKQFMDELNRVTGRENLVTAFWNIWDALFAIDEETGKAIGLISIFKEALHGVIPPMTADRLYNITVKIREFTEKLILSEEQADGLKNILTVLLTPIRWLIDLGKKGFKLLGTIIGKVGQLAGNLVAFFKSAEPAEAILTKLFGNEKAVAILQAWDKAVTNLGYQFGRVKDRAKDLWASFKENKAVQTVLTTAKNALGDIASWISDHILKGLEAISNLDFVAILNYIIDGFKTLIGYLKTAKEYGTNFFKNFSWDSISKWFGNFGEIGKKLNNSLMHTGEGKETIYARILARAEELKAKLPAILQTVKQVITDFAKNITPGRILIFGFSLALVSLIINISKAMNKIAGVADAAAGLIESLTKKAKGLSTFSKIIIMITALTAALWALSKIPADDLYRSATIIGQTLLVLVGAALATGLVTKMFESNAKGIRAMSLLFFSVSISLLALAKALSIISGIDTTNIKTQLKAFGMLLVEFSAVALILGRIAKPMTKSALSFVVFAGSLLAMTFVMKRLSTIDPGIIQETISKLLPAVAALLLLSTMMQGGQNIAKAGTGLLLISGAVVILIQVIKQIASIDSSDLKKGSNVVTQILAIFAGITSLSYFAGANAAKAGRMFISMSIAIGLLSGIIWALSKISDDGFENVKRATIVIDSILGMFALIIFASKNAGKAAGTIVAMSLAIGAITAAIAVLGLGMKWQELTASAGALAATMVAFAAAVKVMSRIGNESGIDWTNIKAMGVGMIAMAVMLGEVVLAFNLLPKDLKWQQIAAYGGAISAIAISLGGTILALNNFAKSDAKSIKGTITAIGEMTLLGVALGGLAAGFALLFSLPAFKKVFGDESAIKSITSAVQLVAALGGEIAILAGMLGLVGMLGKTIGPGVIGFLEVAAALVLVFGGISGIYNALVTTDGEMDAAKVAEMNATLDGAVKFFEKMGEAIGKFAGGVVGGFQSKQLASLGEGYRALLDAFTGIDISSIQNFAALADAMSSFASAGLADSLGMLDLESIGEELNNFIPYITSFTKDVSKIDKDSLSKLDIAAKVMKRFGELFDIMPRSNGALQAIIGEKDLNDFSNGIYNFANTMTLIDQNMKVFKEKYGAIDEEAIKAVVNAGEMFAALQNALPRTGGLAQTFAGTKDLSVFADGVYNFANTMVLVDKHLKVFKESYGEIDQTLVQAVVDAGKLFVSLQNALPRTGGIAQAYMGEKDLSTFSTGVYNFANTMVLVDKHLKVFKEKYGGIDQDLINSVVNAGEMFAALQQALPETGGILQVFNGEQDFDSFSNGLYSFCYGLAKAQILLAKYPIDEEMIKTATNAGEMFKTLSQDLGDSKVKAFFSGEQTLDGFGRRLSEFGSYIKEYSVNTDGVKWDDVAKSAEVLSQLGQMGQYLSGIDSSGMIDLGRGLDALALTNLSEFAEAFKSADAIETLKSAGQDILDGLRQAITSLSDKEMKTSATRVVGIFFVYFTNSVTEKVDGVAASAISLIKGAIITASNNGDLETAGKFIVQGIENGIEANWQLLLDYIKRKAPSIVQAFQEAMEIQSPSKVMRNEVGVFIVQGIAEGIKNDMSAEEQAKKKAENIINAFKEVLDRIDLEFKSIQLDYEFDAVVNPFRTKDQVKADNIALKTKEVKSASDKLEAATAEFKATAKEFAAGTDEYIESENKLKEARIEFQTKRNELAELRSSMIEPSIAYENGKTVVKGFVYGLTADMTMEEAAAQKAQNIVDAFSKEFEKYDYSAGLRDSQKELWDLLNPGYNEHIQGRGLTDAQKEQAEQDARTNQMVANILKNRKDIADQADRVKLAEAQYNAYLKSGIKDRETELALTQQIEEERKKLASLANEQYNFQQYLPSYERAMAIIDKMSQDEIDNFFSTFAEDNSILKIMNAALDVAKSYDDIEIDLTDYFEQLTEITDFEDINNKVSVIFGEELPASIQNAIGSVGSASYDVGAEAAASFENGWYDNLAPEYLEQLIAGNLGGILGAGSNLLAKGKEWFQNTGVVDGITGFINSAGNAASDAFGGLAQNGVDGFLGTIAGAGADSENSGIGFVNKFLDGASGEKGLDSHSPSKATEQLAIYAIMGFHKGLLEKLGILNNDAIAMTDAVLDPMSGIVAKIDQVLQGNLDVQPVISPVLDLTSVTSAAGQLNGMLDMSASYNMAVQAYTEAEEARASRERALAQMVIDGVGAHLAGIGASLDDLRDVVESHGDSDLVIDVNVDGAALARMTVNDYLYASRANGTPFYEANLFSSL